MMLKILLLLTAFLGSAYSIEILYQNKFLLDNEQWSIIGNKNYEPAVHQSYNIDKDLSHYIMFKDNLINVDYKNKNDKTLWYFRSPDILINEEYKPEFNVPFVSSLWEREHTFNNKKGVSQEELNDMFIGTFSIEILGDWTQGMEVVGLDNVIIM